MGFTAAASNILRLKSVASAGVEGVGKIQKGRSPDSFLIDARPISYS